MDSPEYACQLVLVTKLTAVFHASAGVIGGVPGGLLRWSGSVPCTNWKTKRNRMLTAENASTLRAYAPPGLLGFRVGADEAIDAALDVVMVLRRVDPVHVIAQRHMHGGQREDQQSEKHDPRRCGGH